MKYTIEENAVDTLKYAMKYFDAFAYDVSNYEYLKPTIIFLEDSIELLLKVIISSENEEIIYSRRSKSIIEKAREAIKNKPEITLSEYLIKDLDIKTISYTKALKIYCDENWEKNETVRTVLTKLGKYRNAINHFGIDASDKIDDLVCCIYESFQVLTDYMYEHLLAISDYFSYNDFLDIVEPVIEGGIDYVRILCVNNKDKKIDCFTSKLKSVLNSHEFLSFISLYAIGIEDNHLDYESNKISLELYNADKYIFQLDSWYSTFYNATIFSEDGFAYFVIDHDQNLIYLYKNPIYYPYFEKAEDYYQWRREYELDNCIKLELTEDNLFNMLVALIMKEIKDGQS